MYRRGIRILVPLFFVVQALILLSYYIADIAPYPPEAYDQAYFLAHTYNLASSGIVATLLQPFSAGPQTALFFSEGAILELIFRLPRFAALLLNYLMLLSAETVLFLVVRRITSNLGLALISLGLFLSAHTLWFWAGGLFDFRIDWLASCAYGIWCCCVLQSRVFESRRWVVVAVAAACFLILNRYVTITYVLGVEITLLLIVGGYEIAFAKIKRSLNLVASIVAQTVIIVPFLVNNWAAIHDYYIVGHLTGKEKEIRALEFGVKDLLSNLFYYPNSIARDHLGWAFFGMAGVFLLIVAVAFGISKLRRSGHAEGEHDGTTLAIEALFLLGAISAPIAVLTSDLSKSPVVGGIVFIPIVLFLVLIPRWLGINLRSLSFGAGGGLGGILPFAGALFLICGLYSEAQYSFTSQRTTQRIDLQEWEENVNFIVLDAVTNRLREPKVFVNTLSSHFITPVLTTAAYELGYKNLAFAPALSDSIFAPDSEQYNASLDRADYAIVTDAPRLGIYPILRFLDQHDPEIKAWLDKNMDQILELSYDGGTVRTYRRRPNIVAMWKAGSFGVESVNGREFQWLSSDSVLSISRARFSCISVPVFSTGLSSQSVHIGSDSGIDEIVGLNGTDIFHPKNVVLRLPPGRGAVKITFHALDAPVAFPNDGRVVAFGADKPKAEQCGSTP